MRRPFEPANVPEEEADDAVWVWQVIVLIVIVLIVQLTPSTVTVTTSDLNPYPDIVRSYPPLVYPESALMDSILATDLT